MYAAIIDDQTEDALQLQAYIDHFAQESGLELHTTRFSDAARFLVQTEHPYSLVIFDIDMPGINGMEAARQLRKRDPSVVIMFVTKMPQYALAGFEVEAVDYVIKPVDYASFSLKLRKALRYVDQSRERFLLLQTSSELLHIPLWEILYIESQRHYLVYHTIHRDIKVRKTITEAEKELTPLHFSKCNSGFLVNLRHVTSVEREDVVVHGIRLKMSRGCRAGFLSDYALFVGGICL